MQKAISTYIHIKERLHPGILDRLSQGGATAIEIFGARGHFDYTSPQHVREIASWFQSTPGVEFHSIHAPMTASDDFGDATSPLNIASRERKDRVKAMDEIKRAIEVAENAPYRFLIQHIGSAGDTFDGYKFEGALSSIEHLHAFAKPLGVTLLLENIPNELSTPEQLCEVIRTLHFDDLGVCFDLGHAHLQQNVESVFETLKQHIRSTHVHDNNSDRDAHLWPGEGTIDWNNALELLRKAPQVPAVLLEIEGSQNGSPDFGKTVPGRMTETWKKLGL